MLSEVNNQFKDPHKLALITDSLKLNLKLNILDVVSGAHNV